MNEFYEKGYSVVRNFVQDSTLVKLQLYCNKQYKDKKGDYKDEQVEGSPSFYNEEFMNKFQDGMLPKMEILTGLKLFKTYNYWRMYLTGAILRAHTDRAACEISATIQIAGKSWGVIIMNRNEESIQVMLHDGDALLYRGCELLHWRPKFRGNEHAQLFIHYVDQFGSCRDHKNDEVRIGGGDVNAKRL